MATNNVPNRYNWKFGEDCTDILKDLNALTFSYIVTMFSRTARMFRYGGLPEYIPIREIEKILQLGGYVYFKKVKGKIYGFYGGLGGVPNAYYEPTEMIIANPYLKEFSINDLQNDTDGVLIYNDSSHTGLSAINFRYARLIAHADISIKWGLVNARIPSIISYSDDNDKESIQQFFEDVENGCIKGLFNKRFALNNSDNVKTNEFLNATVQSLTSMIEVRQYYYACWLNELGLQANYNMKREAINGEEVGLNEESLKPLVDDMLQSRIEGFKKFNEKFGTNVSVSLASSWKEREKIDTETKNNENENNKTENNEIENNEVETNEEKNV